MVEDDQPISLRNVLYDQGQSINQLYYRMCSINSEIENATFAFADGYLFLAGSQTQLNGRRLIFKLSLNLMLSFPFCLHMYVPGYLSSSALYIA